MSKRRNACRRRRSISAGLRGPAKASGSTLTEFAFVLPLLAMMMFGVIDFGRALYTYHFVSNAAREATRWASVRGSKCNHALSGCSAGPAEVQNFVTSIVPPGIDSSSQFLAVTSTWLPPPGNPASCIGAPNNPGCAVQVHVSYNFKFILPFLPESTYLMQSTSEMVISQ
jgi:TadE-like protein